jgi:hypothetical protein
MNVIVRPINVKGKPLKTSERRASKTYVGRLRIREDRLTFLNRAFTQAELLSNIDGQEAPVLPPLVDARVLWLDDAAMRMTGMEIVEGLQYYQTWDIEVQR